SGPFNYTVTTEGPCENETATGTITVNAISVGGVISPAVTSACMNAPGGTLTLTGYTGDIVGWESSTNGGVSWTPISNTSSVQPYSTIQTTLYRAVIQSGDCPLVYSKYAVVS